MAAAFALGWTLLVFVLLALVPITTHHSVTSTSDGVVTETTERLSLRESEGNGVLLVLVAPVFVPALALAVRTFRHRRRVRRALGIAAFVFCVLGALSVGLFYLPAAVALLASADFSPRPDRSRRI